MADKKKGWVLLYRSIRESWIWSYKPFDPARAWIDLIIDANHKDSKFYLNGKLMEIKRGQKWTSIRVLADRWGWSKERVRKFLKTLESDGMVHTKATQHGTLLTIVKYGDFQVQRDTKRTQTGTQSGHRQVQDKEGIKERLKEGKKEASLSEGEKTVTEDDNDDSSWFDELEDEDDTTEH